MQRDIGGLLPRNSCPLGKRMKTKFHPYARPLKSVMFNIFNFQLLNDTAKTKSEYVIFRHSIGLQTTNIETNIYQFVL